MAPNDSLQAVELSQWTQAAVQIVSKLPAPSNGGPIYLFLGMPAMRTRWMAGVAAHKSDVDVETNPGPTTLNKKVWICDICHKQIHVRKQISIMCNRIEHWVHLRHPSPPTPPRAKHIHMSHTPPTPLTSTSPVLDKTPEPRVPLIHALTATTPHPDPTPALPSPSHPHTLTAHTHATQTTVHASQSPQQPHAQHRVLRQPHKQTKDYHRTTNTTQAQQ